MKKIIILIVIVVVAMLAAAGWYFLSPSASKSALTSEMNKVQRNAVAVENETYQSGSCFDTCASLTRTIVIPTTSDYDVVYDINLMILQENGYKVSTTKEEFMSPTYPNGNPSGRYLTIDAVGKNKYQLRISFQDGATKQPSQSNPSGKPVTSVDQAVYSLSANTR